MLLGNAVIRDEQVTLLKEVETYVPEVISGVSRFPLALTQPT
jgi:hypothetical protein